MPFSSRIAYTTLAGLKSRGRVRPWGTEATDSMNCCRTTAGPAIRLCVELRPCENKWLSGADPLARDVDELVFRAKQVAGLQTATNPERVMDGLIPVQAQ